MEYESFLKIKETYDNFHRFLLKNRMLPFKFTEKGVWGVTPIEETYRFFKKINLSKFNSFIDLGSGDGRVVLIASLFNLFSKGIEYDDWLVKVSKHIMENLKLRHFKNVEIVKSDFELHPISSYDVVFINPDRPFYRGLEEKIKKELKGILIVHGYEFQPYTLKKVNEEIINGEKFSVYKNSIKAEQ